ncbi:MAG: histone deacetylase family protein [Gaiellaceae bacterium]
MSLAMPVVWGDSCRLHDPGGEIWIGVRTQGTEVAARVDAVRDSLVRNGARIVEAEGHPDETLLRVHDDSLLSYLASAWDEWTAAGLPEDPGQDRVVPYVFAHASLTSGRPPHIPAATWAKPGYFAYDTMTLIGPGTWEAARAAVDVALTAVDLVLGGEPTAYGCCRPPGHHATGASYGGSCYLNNAAIAAAELVERTGGPVAVLDIDAHHGNGTQELFYDRADVVVGSVHVDPGAGWFPHFLGFADETGAGPGQGANVNIPLAPGSRDGEWLAAIDQVLELARTREVQAVVVPLGVDAAAGDPESPLRVTAAGFREAGRRIGALGLPTVIVQEGGYDLSTLGDLVAETLLGVEEGIQ